MSDSRFRPLVLALLPIAAAPAFGATCESLAKLALPATTIAAQSVAAGSLALPEGPPIANLPALCRVTGSLKPSADSDIQFEVWLPVSGWNGKFKGIGNGGFAGSMGLRSLGRAVSAGYAAAATDTGHRADDIDATWALGHPEKVIDFGYRAIHEMTVTGKAIAAAFYGRPPQHAYFHACSNGGRQALMEAQRFPTDYDGIVAGAPANHWTHLLAQAAWDLQATTADPAAYIPASKLPAIEAATLAQCDAADGVRDGVVDDPRACAFRPATLLCQSTAADSCLTAPQVAALEKLYAGPRTASGQVHPGHVPGGALGPESWALWVTGPAAGKSLIATFGTQFFRNMVFEDATWDPRTFQLERDTQKADDKLSRVLNATDPDLSAFRRQGGKLIVYHGWSDPAISLSPQRDRVLREREGEDGREAGGRGRPALHVAGRAALRGWPRPRRLLRRGGAPQRPVARRRGRGRALGRGGCRARADHRRPLQDGRSGERRGAHAAPVPLPASGALHRYGQHRRRGQLRLPRCLRVSGRAALIGGAARLSSAMRLRTFGRLGWRVSEVGYGMWGMAGWTGSDDAESAAALDRAVDLGCNFFDTAFAYGDGKSERLLRDALARHPERRLYAATKVPPKNRSWPARAETPVADAFPYDYVVAMTQESRRNLGVERIDLQQLHVWSDAWVGDDGWKRAVEHLKRDGVIEGFGISVNRWQPANVLAALETGLVDSVQVVYNVFDQAPEDALFPACARLGVAVIARVPFDEGSLTGAMTVDDRWPEGDFRNVYFTPDKLRATLARVERLRPLVPAGGSLPDLALRFILHHPAVSTTIPGMRRLRHVEANLAAGEAAPLAPETIAALRAHRWDRDAPLP